MRRAVAALAGALAVAAIAACSPDPAAGFTADDAVADPVSSPPGRLRITSCRRVGDNEYVAVVDWQPEPGHDAADIPLRFEHNVSDMVDGTGGVLHVAAAGAATVRFRWSVRGPAPAPQDARTWSGSRYEAFAMAGEGCSLRAGPDAADVSFVPLGVGGFDPGFDPPAGSVEEVAAGTDPADPSDPMTALAWLLGRDDRPPIDRLYLAPAVPLVEIRIEVLGACLRVTSSYDAAGTDPTDPATYAQTIDVRQERGCDPPALDQEDLGRRIVAVADDEWAVTVSGPTAAVDPFVIGRLQARTFAEAGAQGPAPTADPSVDYVDTDG